MIKRESVEEYLKKYLKGSRLIDFRPLGAGVHGTGFLVEAETEQGVKSYVLKDLSPQGLGHDYPSDRAQVLLLALDGYGLLPNHVKAVDVLSLMPDESLMSVGGGKEYFLLMERAKGIDYFNDLEGMKDKDRLRGIDIKKIKAMASYLSEIHSVKKDSQALYWRKIRDTIGHGECLMGVFDTYPKGILSYEEMATIEKMCVDWRAKLKPMVHRLCQVHGDFHPGNIWFSSEDAGNAEFVLLDRSRGAYGDPADDITALSINYIFLSLKYCGEVKGAYLEGLNLFFEEYVMQSKDVELFEVLAPFFAFRGAVVANPLFYPDLSADARNKIFRFVRNVLSDDKFEISRINKYLTNS